MISDHETSTLEQKPLGLYEVEDVEDGLRTESGSTSSNKEVGDSKRVALNDSKADSDSELEADSGIEADSETESDSEEESNSEGESDSEDEYDSEEEAMKSREASDLWNGYVSRMTLALMQVEPSNSDQKKLSSLKELFIKNPDVAGRIYLAEKDPYRDEDGKSWSSDDTSSEYRGKCWMGHYDDHEKEPESTIINSDTYFYPTTYDYEVPDRYREKWFTSPLYRKRVHERAELAELEYRLDCYCSACFDCGETPDREIFDIFKDRMNDGKDDYFYVSKRNQFKL